MEELFGPITPLLIATVAAGIVQFVKKLTGWEDKKAFALAVFTSFMLTSPYQLLVGMKALGLNPEWTDIGMVAYSSVFYSLTVLSMVLGIYGGAKFLGELNGKA